MESHMKSEPASEPLTPDVLEPDSADHTHEARKPPKRRRKPQSPQELAAAGKLSELVAALRGMIPIYSVTMNSYNEWKLISTATEQLLRRSSADLAEETLGLMLAELSTFATRIHMNIELEMHMNRNQPDAAVPVQVREFWLPLLDGIHARILETTKTLHSTRHVRDLVERKKARE